MIANNLEPRYLTHPGEIIKDELESRGISLRRLAAEIGVPAKRNKPFSEQLKKISRISAAVF